MADWPAYCPAVWEEVEAEVSQNNVEFKSIYKKSQKLMIINIHLNDVTSCVCDNSKVRKGHFVLLMYKYNPW